MSKELDDMLAGITPENRHAEVDFGEAVGCEVEVPSAPVSVEDMNKAIARQGAKAGCSGEQPPPSGVADYILDLARRHGVHETPNDVLANTITRMADDEVTTDEIEDLIVALRQAGVIDEPTMVSLLGRYLDEKHHV